MDAWLAEFDISFKTMVILLGLAILFILFLFLSVQIFLQRRIVRKIIHQMEQQSDQLFKISESLERLDDWMRYFYSRFPNQHDAKPPGHRKTSREILDELDKYKKKY